MPICRLCKERLDKVKGLKGPDRHLIDHVVDKYCIVRVREYAGWRRVVGCLF